MVPRSHRRLHRLLAEGNDSLHDKNIDFYSTLQCIVHVLTLFYILFAPLVNIKANTVFTNK